MVNPFDNSFYKFLIGFICILSISFTILYFVSSYENAKKASLAAPNIPVRTNR